MASSDDEPPPLVPDKVFRQAPSSQASQPARSTTNARQQQQQSNQRAATNAPPATQQRQRPQASHAQVDNNEDDGPPPLIPERDTPVAAMPIPFMLGLLPAFMGAVPGGDNDDDGDDDDDDDEDDEDEYVEDEEEYQESSDEGNEGESLYGLAQKLASKAMSDASADSFEGHLPDLVDEAHAPRPTTDAAKRAAAAAAKQKAAAQAQAASGGAAGAAAPRPAGGAAAQPSAGLRRGYLLNQDGSSPTPGQAPKPAQPYSQTGVGRREAVGAAGGAPAAATAGIPAPRPQSTTPVPGGATKKAATKPKATAKAPAKPKEFAVATANAEELQRIRQEEREAMRRQVGLAQGLDGSGDPEGAVLGRCCLRPGAQGVEPGSKGGLCEHKERLQCKVKESHKRLVVTCSEGCSLLFHFPYCWRHFKDTYRQNVNDKFEDILNKGQGKTQQALPCLTEGCRGWIRSAVLQEGPRTHLSKTVQYEVPAEVEAAQQAARQRERDENIARSTKRKITEDVVWPTKAEKQQRKAAKAKRADADAAAAAPAAAPAAPAAAVAASNGVQGVGGGIKIAHRRVASEEMDPAEEGVEEDESQHQDQMHVSPPEEVATVPEFLLPDDALLKPVTRAEEPVLLVVPAKNNQAAQQQQPPAAPDSNGIEAQPSGDTVAAAAQDEAGPSAAPAPAAKKPPPAPVQQQAARKKKGIKLNLADASLGFKFKEEEEEQQQQQEEEAAGGRGRKKGRAAKSTTPLWLAPPAATEHAGIAAPAPPLAGTSHRAPIILGPNAWEGQNRNRPAPGITMAHFPSLAHAAEARGGAEQQGQQGAGAGDPADEQMRLVLARLRIEISNPKQTPHLLIDCINVRALRDTGENMEEFMTRLICEEVCRDAEVVQMAVFESQQAVAVTLGSQAQAFTCCYLLQSRWVDKSKSKLQVCFLEDFPSDDVIESTLRSLERELAGEAGEQVDDGEEIHQDFWAEEDQANWSAEQQQHQHQHYDNQQQQYFAGGAGRVSPYLNPVAPPFQPSTSPGATAAVSPDRSGAGTTTAAAAGTFTRKPLSAASFNPAAPEFKPGSFGAIAGTSAGAAAPAGAPAAQQQQPQEATAAGKGAGAPGAVAEAGRASSDGAALVPIVDVLHFANTTTAVLEEHYRPHSEIMLDMEIFNGPHLVNSPKRVALMLYNLDTGKLEGLWSQVNVFQDLTGAGKITWKAVHPGTAGWIANPSVLHKFYGIPFVRFAQFLQPAGVSLIQVAQGQAPMLPAQVCVEGETARSVLRLFMAWQPDAVKSPTSAAAPAPATAPARPQPAAADAPASEAQKQAPPPAAAVAPAAAPAGPPASPVTAPPASPAKEAGPGADTHAAPETQPTTVTGATGAPSPRLTSPTSSSPQQHAPAASAQQANEAQESSAAASAQAEAKPAATPAPASQAPTAASPAPAGSPTGGAPSNQGTAASSVPPPAAASVAPAATVPATAGAPAAQQQQQQPSISPAAASANTVGTAAAASPSPVAAAASPVPAQPAAAPAAQQPPAPAAPVAPRLPAALPPHLAAIFARAAAPQPPQPPAQPSAAGPAGPQPVSAGGAPPATTSVPPAAAPQAVPGAPFMPVQPLLMSALRPLAPAGAPAAQQLPPGLSFMTPAFMQPPNMGIPALSASAHHQTPPALPMTMPAAPAPAAAPIAAAALPAALQTPTPPPQAPAPGAAPAAAASTAAPARAAATPSPTPGAGAPGRPASRIACVMCGANKASFVSPVCRHVGPCLSCMPNAEQDYKECKLCGKPVEGLKRIFI